MAEVLVLAERDAGGEVKKVTLELLTAARRLGEPSVVWTGPGADAAQPRLAEYGADKVYAADCGRFRRLPGRARRGAAGPAGQREVPGGGAGRGDERGQGDRRRGWRSRPARAC